MDAKEKYGKAFHIGLQKAIDKLHEKNMYLKLNRRREAPGIQKRSPACHDEQPAHLIFGEGATFSSAVDSFVSPRQVGEGVGQ